MDNFFNQEIEICKKQSKKNSGKCNWGKCKDCGVVPLLYKIYRGDFIDEPEEIKELKIRNEIII